jgi:hypothetical protein
MDKFKILEKRIGRVKSLFKELKYTISAEQKSKETYSCELENEKGFKCGLFMDCYSKFTELSYSFSFSIILFNFLKQNIEDVLKICYEYGCYFNMERHKSEMILSVFTKGYFSGLNYFSLKDTVCDFKKCVVMITKLLEFSNFNKNMKRGL